METLTVLVWGLEDITMVVQAAAVEAGIEGFRVLCPVFGCPRAPKRGKAQWVFSCILRCTMVSAVQRLLGNKVPHRESEWVGHLLVGEDTCDTTISGSEYG